MTETESTETVGNFCNSCGRNIVAVENSVTFKCPNCSSQIARCGKCRSRGVQYACRVCGFLGP